MSVAVFDGMVPLRKNPLISCLRLLNLAAGVLRWVGKLGWGVGIIIQYLDFHLTAVFLICYLSECLSPCFKSFSSSVSPGIIPLISGRRRISANKGGN